ncbi:HNH endonuclease [Streptomyces sp. MI02-7b]|uniref:HNH endonuclease signature motif containing protein n=1 Tax=Streptomyces sp. MI02-7b TaxID=462941 RepID=UPI0029AB8090|nr:HNH endonuclease [Streptomyces sp. MI02-7b]MDX3077265.1 HNH endonuclease [Streptomyces sp. MI02-7b]
MPTTRWTRELLEYAVASSRTLSEAMGKLGLDPKSPTRKYIRVRLRKLGVDTSHFEREGGRWTREVLASAVAACTNMTEVLRHLGVEVVGGQHTHISRRIRAFGIDTSHFFVTSRGSRGCSPQEVLAKQDPSTARRMQSDRLKRAMLANGVIERCALCGTGPEWCDRPLPLEVDHLNGDWRDNRLPNLRLLCPNCHSTTDTYRGRGKLRARNGVR